MPYKDPAATRLANRERQRRYRVKKKAEREAAEEAPVEPVPDDPVGVLVGWSEKTLRVPPGHPLAGQPLSLPDYGEAFLRDALSHRESLLCIARKSAKSAIVAVYLLARLVGPLARPGYRGIVASVSKDKAGELKRQMQEIAEASGLRRSALPPLSGARAGRKRDRHRRHPQRRPKRRTCARRRRLHRRRTRSAQ